MKPVSTINISVCLPFVSEGLVALEKQKQKQKSKILLLHMIFTEQAEATEQIKLQLPIKF